jgi:hypothetical protein
MKKILFALVLLAATIPAGRAAAQAYYTKEFSLYAEFFGAGGEASLNFEKLLGETISLRVGGGLTGVVFRKGFVVPVTGSVLFGGRQSKLELGGGGAWVDIDDNGTEDTFLNVAEDQLVVTGIAGYRWLDDFGFTFRLAYTPAITKDGLEHMGGVMFGYSF